MGTWTWVLLALALLLLAAVSLRFDLLFASLRDRLMGRGDSEVEAERRTSPRHPAHHGAAHPPPRRKVAFHRSGRKH